MFPTSGLFQEFTCPLYAEGVCDRPYCHFSHVKSGSNPVDTAPIVMVSSVETAMMKSSEAVNTPVYKPTPIKLLDKWECNAALESPPETLEMTENGNILSVPSIPIYQPTPISELEKYAPNAIPLYGLNGKQLPFRSPEPPTYSPVVRLQVKTTVAPTTQLTPFVYQPSPAYPPVTEPPESADSTNTVDLTHFSTETDDTHLPNPNRQSVLHSADQPDRKNPSSASRKLKRSHKQKPDTTVLSPQTSNGSPSSIPDKRNLVTSLSIDEEIEEPSRAATIEKRQKLLALYNDLYGEQPTPSKHSSMGQKKNSVIPIAPYLGTPVAKMPKKDSDVENQNTVAPDDASGMNAVTVTLVPRPRVPLRKSDKIPMPIRTRYLDQFIEECLVIYECPNDAYDRALSDEQACHDKATSRMAYLNAVIQRLKSLKAEKTKVLSEGTKKPTTMQYITAARKMSSDCVTADTFKDNADLVEEHLNEAVQGHLLYKQLRNYVLTEEQLIANGFPREDKSAGTAFGKAKLHLPDDKRSIYGACLSNERLCARCGARFTVDEFGNAVVPQKCVYHWGRPVKQRTPGAGFDFRYVCCQGELGQPGCQLCPHGHVHESNKWLDNEGFVATLPPLAPTRPDDIDDADQPVNVYAIDCEMVYTTGGCELGRVTIVDPKLQPILDSIVRPYGTIVDCNTRFSGLKPEQLEQSDTRITDIQSKLLHLFDSDTILVGHSLESDLTALKLIHGKVVDTSIMFPHRFGPPKKRALRNLVCEMLHRIIQQDDCGHNSLEDAVACMQLVQYKVKEDLRRGKWSLK